MSGAALVVGAGVTGASVARELAIRGWDVTLAEQYAPGTIRSASGGDTRLLRAAHGGEEWYTQLAWRARTLWLELQQETGTRIWEPTGLAWFAQSADGFETRSVASLERAGIACEWRPPSEAHDLFPAFAPDGLEGVLWEPDAGVLHARRATQLLADDGERRGVRPRAGRIVPADDPAADVVVWACGAWLPALFPEHVEVRVERRDVFFFGADASWRDTPGWVDYDAGFYGHGDVGGLGVKVAPDLPSDEVDPDTVERVPLRERERSARAYAGRRFPALAGAPLVGARVCQYDLSSDTHFLLDRHPERASWWLVGAGSGHGFKHGPALAEYVADCAEGARDPEPFHALGPRSGNARLRTAA
ncbi:MAG TPA: FAD-dependent oxidoreductase [Gaiellaceae bacterium]|nr:FAD-dependent oxidoreductase [Gaiellaceae bacterium]